MSILNKRLGAKWWALFTVQMLLSLFCVGAIAGWWANFTLGQVAMVVIILLLRPMLVLRRRAAGARGEWSENPSAAKPRNRRRRILGIALVVLGIILGTLLIMLGIDFVTTGVESFSNSTLMLGLGLGTSGIGIILVRYSFGRVYSPGATSGEEAVPKAIGRFERFMRIVGTALVPLNVFFLGCLNLDAVHGFDKAWPLFTFFGIGLVSGMVWLYLYVRWLTR